MKTINALRLQNKNLFITVGLVVCALFFTTFSVQEHIHAESDMRKGLESLSQTFRDIVKDVGPAVVYISTEQTVRNQARGTQHFHEFWGDDFMRRFFGDIPQNREFKRQGLGSGFITSDDGYILTNNHVVENADIIKVTLADKREFDAKIIGTDPKTDVAVIKIDGDDLPTVTLGSSDELEVGDWAIAIGTPFGLSQTVTAGIISAEGRSNIGINDYEDFIQTDAAINPGNSGGPLVNIYGQVIGINTAIFSRSGGYQGIGFAIPIDMAKSIQHSLIKDGKVVRGWLGVMIQAVTPEIAKGFDLEDTTGTLVGDVLKGSPAEKAGLERGDVIITFDGQAIDGPNSLKNIVARTAVQKKVDVVVIRNGKKKTINVLLGEQPGDSQITAEAPSETAARFGLSVQELTDNVANKLGYIGEDGVVISNVEPHSPASEAGLRRGDLIKEINKKPLHSIEDYNDAMKRLGDEKSFLALIQRGGNTLFVVVSAE
ncbi:serine protease [candidate division KSB3 bacterium]|uniref:Probable periplasmic serine endoprotease DegP-like n=1 Tax=candidate division KSB3 bacterium TaxID=2044937 RepID=A0A2G6E3U9_9BACT|nr:MAG: serine protease [candidate division KSB3 bacterium]PIE29378.1 MAG: serine protease [candidate division KSB3 bacterium]